MVNQQKVVQQETAYSAVVVNGIPVPAYMYITFSCFYDPFWGKNDIGTGIHSLQLQFLVALLFDLPSFHEMIFTLVPLIFLR